MANLLTSRCPHCAAKTIPLLHKFKSFAKCGECGQLSRPHLALQVIQVIFSISAHFVCTYGLFVVLVLRDPRPLLYGIALYVIGVVVGSGLSPMIPYVEPSASSYKRAFYLIVGAIILMVVSVLVARAFSARA